MPTEVHIEETRVKKTLLFWRTQSPLWKYWHKTLTVKPTFRIIQTYIGIERRLN